MAGGQKIRIAGYLFEARPKSMWRKISHDFVPYWQSWTPSFEVIVTREEEDTGERELQWFMLFSDNSYVEKSTQIPPFKKGGEGILPLEGNFLGPTGDTQIVLDSKLNILPRRNTPGIYKTIYSFNVTPKTWVSLAVFAGAVAGVLTIICQYLISLVVS